MAISFIHEPNAIVQSLLGFGAGFGSQSNQNELIEQERRYRQQQELNRALMAAGSDIGQGFMSAARSRDRFRLEEMEQEHMLDREMLRQTGMTYREIQELSRKNQIPIAETVNELRARRLQREEQARFESMMTENGYKRGWTPSQIQNRNELHREAMKISQSPDLTGAERLQLMQDISQEMSDLQPAWVPNPDFARPTPDQIVQQNTYTDKEGRIFSTGFRNGAPNIQLIYDPSSKDKMPTAQLGAQQKLIDSAMKAAMKRDMDGNEVFSEPDFYKAYNAAAKVMGFSPAGVSDLPIPPGEPEMETPGPPTPESISPTGKLSPVQSDPIVMSAVSGDPGAIAQVVKVLKSMGKTQKVEYARMVNDSLQQMYGNNPENVPMELEPLLIALERAR